MNLINELRMLAEDLHVNGYNRYSAAMSKAADELDKWEAVFGHLGGTPDECGNAIIAARDELEERTRRLESALPCISHMNHGACTVPARGKWLDLPPVADTGQCSASATPAAAQESATAAPAHADSETLSSPLSGRAAMPTGSFLEIAHGQDQ